MLLSIITINYNNSAGLRKTIESVVNQSWKEFEYIIIDGGSTDGSVEVVNEFADRIDYWVSEPDKGIYNAMNKGIDKANGEYCLFLNSGDALADYSVFERVFDKPSKADIIMCRLRLVPSNVIAYSDVKPPITFLNFYKGNPVPHPASFIKTELCRRIRYDEAYKIVSDWKFFMQAIIIEHCSYEIRNDVLTDFEEGGISNNRLDCERERAQILKQLFPERVLMDYLRGMTGFAYKETSYDLLFVQLRGTKWGKIVYTFAICILRVAGVFTKRAKKYSAFPLISK